MFSNDLFLMPFAKMTIPELTTWLLGTATLQEKHPFHGTTMPDWVPAWARFREHADCLTSAAKAAENKDIAKSKERDDEHAAVLQSIDINACYIVIRSKHENDDSLLHGMGYEIKDKTKRTHLHPANSISRVPLILTVKRGSAPGSVVVNFQKDPGAGLYQLQICKGEPTGEGSYEDGGSFKLTRTVIVDLDRACWYYFRGRSQGNNETSPWSAPVGIIVV
jgi:hypothetical protein